MAAPVYVKGGVWSNLEDQILKAAVSKYGTHQWSKIASLLQKKSSRQCEIRWNEYLKPSLDFSQFSKDEDVKLLNLARKLPNQWRTISSLLNRPAQTCIERYNKLLLGVVGDDADIKKEDNVLKPGDINPHTDTQVALPDKEELDDDEREMLAEAKVRLLATQGKKATRKIRERMLEESKRIAQLQKRREMKQAGISSGIKKSRKRYASEIDYNADIPYEQEPLPGIYDTSKEDERMMRQLSKFENMVMRKGLKEDDDEEEKVSKKHKKNDKNDKSKLEKVDTTIPTRLNVPKTTTRPKLILSAPGTEDMTSHEKLLADERNGIMNSRDIGSVFVDSHEESIDVKKNERAHTTITTQDDTEFDRFMRKRQLIQLFAMLPTPKNDYDILVSDDETAVEDTEDVNEEDTEDIEEEDNEFLQQEDIEKEEDDITLQLPSMLHENLPVPSFKTQPKDEYDMVYNEILLKSMKQEDYQVSIDEYANFIKVEQEIETMKQGDATQMANPLQEITSSLDKETSSTVDSLQRGIATKLEQLSQLQSNVDYIRPLVELNKKLSQRLTEDKLPHLSRLQQEYFVKYKIYRQRNTTRRPKGTRN